MDVAPEMGAKGPEAEAPSAHCQLTLVGVPSMSVTDAVSVSPPDSVPVIVTVPGSSRLLTLMVTAMVSSHTVSLAPLASFLSRTSTTTE